MVAPISRDTPHRVYTLGHSGENTKHTRTAPAHGTSAHEARRHALARVGPPRCHARPARVGARTACHGAVRWPALAAVGMARLCPAGATATCRTITACRKAHFNTSLRSRLLRSGNLAAAELRHPRNVRHRRVGRRLAVDVRRPLLLRPVGIVGTRRLLLHVVSHCEGKYKKWAHISQSVPRLDSQAIAGMAVAPAAELWLLLLKTAAGGYTHSQWKQRAHGKRQWRPTAPTA